MPDERPPRQERYARLAQLFKEWIAHASPYDAIAAKALCEADDLTMRCAELDRHFDGVDL